MKDALPQNVLDNMKDTVKQYRKEEQEKDILNVYETLIKNRKEEFNSYIELLNKNNAE